MLAKIQILLFALFFIFNFFDRSISNIFLILTLLSCLYDFDNLKSELIKKKQILIAIIIFTLWIFVVGMYHNSPISELDNYFRFLLLLPLFVIKIKYQAWSIIILLSAITAITHLIFNYSDQDMTRYNGSSSHVITYASMITTLLVLISLSLRNYFSKRIVLFFLLCLISLLFFLWVMTATRGPIIGVVLAFMLIVFWQRSKLFLFLGLLPLIFLLFLPNQLSDRFSPLLDSNLNLMDRNNISQFLRSDSYNLYSLRERVTYLVYGYSVISNYPIVGTGPQNIEKNMKTYIENNKFTAEERDHLHNEYIDISAKFGLPSLFFYC